MLDDFEERLRAVPWDRLEHSYGSAEDVPMMVLELRSAHRKHRQHARSNLQHSLNHQGVQRWDATTQVVPFLFELLRDTSLRDRHLILPVLADFAVGSTDGYYLIFDFHIDQVCLPEGTQEYGYFVYGENKGSDADIAYGKMLRGLYDEVKKGIPQVIAMLDERRQPVRMYAAHFLGWMTDAAPEIVPALTARLKKEYDGRVRASLAVALSYVTTFDEKLRAEIVPLLDDAWAKASSERVEQRMVMIARLRCGDMPEAMQSPLLDMLRQPPAETVPYDEFAWAALDDADALLALASRHAPEWVDAIARAICDGLRDITSEHDALAVAQGLLFQHFTKPPADQAPRWYDAYRPVMLEDLSPLQIYVLQALADSEITWHFSNIQGTLNDFGLPAYRDRLQRFLAGEGDVMRFRYEPEAVMPPEWFARLNGVNWRELRGNFGDAADLPDMIRALLAPEAAQRAAARRKLRASLRHEKEVTAAGTALPFLLQIVANPAAPDRHLLMILLVDLVTGSATGHRQWGYESEYYYLAEGFHVDVNYSPAGTKEEGFTVFYQNPGSDEDIAYGQRQRALYDTLLAKRDIFLTLLTDPDAKLRSYAAFVLAWLTTLPHEIAKALQQPFINSLEPDPQTRASLVLAMAVVIWFDDERGEHYRSFFEQRLNQAKTPLEKRAAAIALLISGATTANVKAALRESLLNREAPPVSISEFPWARLDDDRVLLDIVLRHAPANWKADFADVGCTLLKRMDEAQQPAEADDEDDENQSDSPLPEGEFDTKPAKPDEELANVLLARFFKELDSDDRMDLATSTPAKSPRKLSAAQRQIMQTIVDADMLWDDNGYPHLALLGYGFNGYRKEIRAMLKK